MKDRGYKITDENFYFTELGDELYELRDDPDELYDGFAKHILRNLHGLKGIEVVEDLEAEGRKTVNDNVKEEFKQQYDSILTRPRTTGVKCGRGCRKQAL